MSITFVTSKKLLKMEAISWSFDNFLTHLSAAFFNMVSYGLVLGLFGLALGIFAVIKARRKGFFQRSNSLWSGLVKINYLLIPLVFMVFGGAFGGVLGVHNAIDDYVDTTTQPIVDYATGYLPELQSFINIATLENPKAFNSIDDAVMAFNTEVEAQRIKVKTEKPAAFSGFEASLAGCALDVFGQPGEFMQPLVMFASIDFKNLKKQDFEVLPTSLKACCSYWLWPFYAAVFFPFSQFLLVIIGEYLLFFFLFKKKEKPQLQTSDLEEMYV